MRTSTRNERVPLLALIGVLVLVVGCGGSTTEPEGPENPANPVDAGTTTPSSVPVGDYPPIPLPTNAGGTTVTRSDTSTTIVPLANDFRPAILGLTGDNWDVGQVYGGTVAPELIRTCFFSVFTGTGRSSDINYPQQYVECPFSEGGAYWYVRYPPRGAYIDTWLRDRYDAESADAPAFRLLLVKDGASVAPEARTTLFHEHLIEVYTGDRDFSLPRSGCMLDGTLSPASPGCTWRILGSASVKRRPVTNPVHVRKDVYWEKADNSEIFPNFQAGPNQHEFKRSWTVGTEDGQTTQFGWTLGAEVGGQYSGIAAKVSGTLSETFGTSLTVQSSETKEETFHMTIAGKTTAVFEIWNLTEQYTFVNADGTPYTDPNYAFTLPDLTRKATIATARTTVEFPND